MSLKEKLIGEVMEVLLVEDNPADQMLAQQAFKDANTPCTLNIVADGEQAMMYLRNIDQYKNANRPKLILLDLNMPKMDGHEVLEAVKMDPELADIPVVILTTSSNPKRCGVLLRCSREFLCSQTYQI